MKSGNNDQSQDPLDDLLDKIFTWAGISIFTCAAIVVVAAIAGFIYGRLAA